MTLGVDSAIGMKSDLQTNLIPFVVDKEIIVQGPRQSWRLIHVTYELDRA